MDLDPRVLTFLLVAIVVGRFLFRELRDRRMDRRAMFVLPAFLGMLALYFGVVGAGMYPYQRVAGIAVFASCALVGAVLGFAVAHETTVRLGTAPYKIVVRGSFTTVAIWLLAFALRLIPRFAFPSSSVVSQLFLNVGTLTMLAVALLTSRLLFDATASRLERAPVEGVVAGP